MSGTTSSREQRRAAKRIQQKSARQTQKAMEKRQTPEGARKGCLGCLLIVVLILAAIVVINQMWQSRKSINEPAKKPAATQKK